MLLPNNANEANGFSIKEVFDVSLNTMNADVYNIASSGATPAIFKTLFMIYSF